MGGREVTHTQTRNLSFETFSRYVRDTLNKKMSNNQTLNANEQYYICDCIIDEKVTAFQAIWFVI